MLETKLIEIRDRNTLIPALAVYFKPDRSDADYLLRRAGFGRGYRYVVLTRLTDTESRDDPFKWAGHDARTMGNAHAELESHWERYASGGVLDVEFILGETNVPKTSENVPLDPGPAPKPEERIFIPTTTEAAERTTLSYGRYPDARADLELKAAAILWRQANPDAGEDDGPPDDSEVRNEI